MNIRLEQPVDYREVENLTREAFWIAFEQPNAFEEFEATFPPKEKKVQDGQIIDDCMKNPNEQ